MSTSDGSSKESAANPQASNPYAPSEVPEGQDAPPAAEVEPVPHYQLRMAWSDRRRFLRTVGLLRLASLISALMGVWALFGLMQAWVEFYRGARFQDSHDLIMLFRFFLSAAKGGLALYVCFLNWKLADALGKTAGGTSNGMFEWSALQLQLARMMLVTLLLAGLTMGSEWLIGRLLAQGFGQ
jgi:hypothetical protein